MDDHEHTEHCECCQEECEAVYSVLDLDAPRSQRLVNVCVECFDLIHSEHTQVAMAA